MMAQKFLEWIRTASAVERAEGAGMLARAFLYDDLPEPEREEARLILTALLDDSSPRVRRALAENFASATTVPHYMVLTLAGDHSDIAAIVLARSPLLSDAELVDCAATSDAFAQSAIALRPSVPAPVAAALAEVGACEALISLALNPGAEVLEFSLRRMIERHGHGNKHLLEAALCELTGLPMARVAGFVAESKGAGFAALYRKAHMPERLLPAFVAGLEAVAQARCGGPMNAELRRPIITRVLEACALVNRGELDPLIARLRHLEAEAARNEARDFRRAVAPQSQAMRGSGQGFEPPQAQRVRPRRKNRERPHGAKISRLTSRLSKRRSRRPEPCRGITGRLLDRGRTRHRRA